MKILLLLLATPVYAGVSVTITQSGEIHCSGCRYKTIDGVKYVCTGSLSDERCTKHDVWIKNVRTKPKKNVDMSHLRK